MRVYERDVMGFRGMQGTVLGLGVCCGRAEGG